MVVKIFFLLLPSLLTGLVSGKIFKRCELAWELKIVHNVPNNQLATWVCIAKRESKLNTSRVSPPKRNGSRLHGLFQISDKYWCSGEGKGCQLPCCKLKDDDITDDLQCARKIFKKSKRIRGNGFKEWWAYDRYCKGRKARKYIKGCF